MLGKTNHETPYFRDSSYYGHSQISWLLISIPTWAPNVSRKNNKRKQTNKNKQTNKQKTNKQTNKQKNTQKKKHINLVWPKQIFSLNLPPKFVYLRGPTQTSTF